MTTYVRVLYDFTGEPNTSEMTVTVGEVLTVTRTDVGEGWWEGKNSKGDVGLFPAAYVEYMSAAEFNQIQNGNTISTGFSPPSSSVTSPVAANNNAAIGNRYDQAADEWNDGQDDWDDDWDDDNEYSEIGPSAAAAATKQQQQQQINKNQNNQYTGQYNQQTQQTNYANIGLPAPPADDTMSVTSNAHSTIKRAGLFSKTDSYILGASSISVSENEKITIIQVDNFYNWQPITSPYTVKVASPKKETKFKGMKSFIAYQLTPSFNNNPVSRRYKHFDWLHERLVDKFTLIPIPPLPDKQISGRYEEEFIEHRRVQLQEFVDWVCRHPVLSICEVWMHFLTCTDEKKWKTGKRTAEKDPLVGFDYCLAICPPERNLLQSYVDGQMELCLQFTHSMGIAVKTLLSIATEQIKRNQIDCRRDFQRIGEGFADLAKALEIDERRQLTGDSLSLSLARTSGCFISIGQLFGEQPKHDWIPFSDRFHIYRGILNSFPHILSAHRSTIEKRKECERLTSEQKMNNLQLVEVGRRCDIVSYTVLAETSHFRQERDQHLKRTMCSFIDSQIEFYTNIITKLQDARKQFQ